MQVRLALEVTGAVISHLFWGLDFTVMRVTVCV